MRSVHGNRARTVDEEGVADGVSFSTPFPITGLDSSYEVTNPTGFAEAFIGQRAAGGNDWLELASDATIHATATVWSPTTTIVGTPTQLVWSLIPALGNEVDQTWRRQCRIVHRRWQHDNAGR
jgi:hypothetical protein